jgi:hypothetical protein
MITQYTSMSCTDEKLEYVRGHSKTILLITDYLLDAAYCSYEIMKQLLMIRLVVDNTVDRQFIESMHLLPYNSCIQI